MPGTYTTGVMHFLSVLKIAAAKIGVGLALLLSSTTTVTIPDHKTPTPLPAGQAGLPAQPKIAITPTSTAQIAVPFPSFGPQKTPAATTTIKSIPKPVATTKTPAKTPVPPTKTQTPLPAGQAGLPSPVQNSQPQPEPSPTLAPGDLNAAARSTIVNILCNVGGSGSLDPISGTGIIIDPKGVVLTNAHVGQFFLLRNYPTRDNIDCILRTGNPARPTYRAELLYLPLAWVQSNAKKITQSSPTGTGERDYALLYITERIDKAPLPAALPYLVPYTGDAFALGDEMLLAGYPADFIGGITIQTNLNVASALGKIEEIFTFHEGGDADLISVPGTILSQRGASGGAAVEADGKLAGLIATATTAASTGQRDLRAVTLHHIDQTLTQDTGRSLIAWLANDPAAQARLFNLNTAPTLTRMLTDVLENR
jgi:hypothetical protein